MSFFQMTIFSFFVCLFVSNSQRLKAYMLGEGIYDAIFYLFQIKITIQFLTLAKIHYFRLYFQALYIY